MTAAGSLKLILAAAAAALFAFPSPPASAQDYPTRPVTVIVPFAPGGATDNVARAVTAKMRDKLGQQIVIENRPGAGGAVGAQHVARSRPDGYTLLYWNSGFVTAPHLSQLQYDHLKDFEPVALAGSTPTIISVHPNLPAKNLTELIALAKSKPGEINFGSSGLGSSDHLAVELLQSIAGIKMTHVPYKGGSPAAAAAVAGEVQLLGLSPGTVTGQLRAGQLRGLAVASERRLPSLPDVPTSAESGLPEYVVPIWLGMWAPAGTPKPIVAKLNEAARDALADEEVRKTLANVGVEAVGSSSDEFAAMVHAESERWGKIIREARITLQ
jgi:tripartite-type tricarboxylate transporter receptor subunit TctC